MIDLFTPSPAPASTLPLCPSELLPDAVVSASDPLLLVPFDDAVAAIRASLSRELIKVRLDAIWEMATKRDDFGQWGLLGFIKSETAYMCDYSGSNARDWLHKHEREMILRLQQALPSPGQLREEASMRIKERVAARKALRESRASA